MTAVIVMFQLAASYLRLTDASHILNSHEDISCGRGTDVTVSESNYLLQGKKTTTQIAKTTKIGLRMVQGRIKPGRIVLNRQLQGRNVVKKKKKNL